MIDMLRALAGIAASTNMDKNIQEEAYSMMRKIMKLMDKQIDIEAIMMKKASAEMNGIIS